MLLKTEIELREDRKRGRREEGESGGTERGCDVEIMLIILIKDKSVPEAVNSCTVQ